MSSLRYPPLRAFASPSLTQSNRAFRLHWVSAQSSLEQVLIAHRIDISEGLCSGIVGHVTCLSTRADLPLNAFIGLPLSVQMVTNRGALHPICAIVTDARGPVGRVAGDLPVDPARCVIGAGGANQYAHLPHAECARCDREAAGRIAEKQFGSRARSISTCRRWIARSIRCARRCCSFTSRTM
jgi:hypothetical protein